MTDKGIKTLRQELDRMIRSIELSELSSRPISLAVTNLENGRMWLGESLQELGLATPYKDSLDPTNKKIAARADIYRETLDGAPANESPVKYVKELRVELVKASEKIRQEIVNGASGKRFYKIAMSQAYVHICNARMWLGNELNRRCTDGGG